MSQKITSEVNDIEIIECLRNGHNHSVLKQLYERVFPKIKAYICANSGNTDEALDIFQDAVVILCRYIKAGRYNETHELSGFLYSVSRNLWINKTRREKKKVIWSDADLSIAENDFSNEIITQQKANLLKDLLSKLGEKCVKLLKQSVYYKRPNSEIAEEMGFASVNGVKTQKYKCKQKLHALIASNPAYEEVLE